MSDAPVRRPHRILDWLEKPITHSDAIGMVLGYFLAQYLWGLL